MKSVARSEMENVSRDHTFSGNKARVRLVSRAGRYWLARLRYGTSAYSVAMNGIHGYGER